MQSAMLKRSDSVNKRWSAQPGTGLSRGNSIASNRCGYEGSRYAIPSLNAPRDQVLATSSRETSPVASSRPDSSHRTATHTRPAKENDTPGLSAVTEQTRSTPPPGDRAVKPVPPQDESPSELPTQEKNPTDDTAGPMSPPSSPSKKWSPTKSSWLENAINKPDSPKPRMPLPSQPSWMTNINQAKQQRGSVDLGKGSNFREVSTSGFLRSPPMGAAIKSTGIGGLRAGLKDDKSNNMRTESSESLPPPNADQAKNPAQDIRSSTPSRLAAQTTAIKDVSESPSAGTASEKGTPSKPSQDPGFVGNNAGSPRPIRPKPETPPKQDFRSNLKPRQPSADKKPSGDPEFKNVFGKLKRTQTQNYVAPDELKDNILRGKAGLAVTGGPKKTERRDEFKESLLKQKEAMKSGSPPSVGRKPSTRDTAKEYIPSASATLPKRNDVEARSSLSDANIDVAANKQQPEALAGLKRLKEKSQPTSLDIPSAAPVKPQNISPINGRLGQDFNSALVGMLSRGPSPLTGGTSQAPDAISEKDVGTTAPTEDASQPTTEGPHLTHMTKSRARGPKRRLPTTPETNEGSASPKTPEFTKETSTTDLTEVRSHPKPNAETPSIVKQSPQPRPLASISDNHRKPSQPQSPRKPSVTVEKLETSEVLPITAQAAELKPIPTQPGSPPSTAPKPSTPSVDRLRKPSASVPSRPNNTSILSPEQSDAEKFESSTRQPTQTRSASHEERPSTTVRGAAAKWSQVQAPMRKPSPPRARSPIRLPSRKDEEAAMQDAGLIAKGEAINGLGITNVKQEPRTPAPAKHDLPTPALSSPKSPPLPAKKPESIASRVVSATESVSKINGSPIPQTSEATRLFAELFDESPDPHLKVNIDTPAVLSSRTPTSETDKIRTLRKQIWEVTAGGKLIPVPPDQGHILFEESLYICHHVFGSPTGTRTTEVYLWCGDGVATSAIEDAQIFARKEAKDHGGKLIVLSQGKETARFFQALGGIVITRHGQSDRASSRYMLCGRRHVSQIAFDEVDFLPRSLCKGFPYIISSGSGKIHLWKGTGSGVDELGCARLIGMDLGLGGEIGEIEDGREPDSFWRLFPNGQQQPPVGNEQLISKHWQLKPSSERYATRLYQVDIEAPRPKSSTGFKWGRRGSAPATDETTAFTAQIREIVPFAQTDIFHDGVFVLDVFFEIFVYADPFFSSALLTPDSVSRLVYLC